MCYRYWELQYDQPKIPLSLYVCISIHIIVCKPVGAQQLQDKQIYKSHCCVMALQTNRFPWQRLNYNSGKCVFYTVHAKGLESSQLWDIR
jgi:hypothetical protein